MFKIQPKLLPKIVYTLHPQKTNKTEKELFQYLLFKITKYTYAFSNNNNTYTMDIIDEYNFFKGYY